MNEEKQIRYSKYLIISFALIAVLIIFFKLFGGGTSGNNNDVQEQFNEFQTIINRQENLLIGLSNTLELQQMNSNELKKLIEEQRLSYQKIRSELTSAQESLSNSKNNSRAKQILRDVERTNKERTIQK